MLVRECSTTEEWQEVKVPSATEEGKFYVVTLPPWERTLDETICECPSFVNRGYCRHQREALAMACSWNELDGKPMGNENECPECGAPVRMVEM